MLTEKTFKELSDEVASKKPAPGGGSVAAIAGTLASALDSMICNLTIGNEKYLDVEEEMQSYLEKSECIRKRLTELIEEDAKAFDMVMDAYRLPKDNPKRKVWIKEALMCAAKVPFEVAQESYKAIKIAAELVEKGNKNAITDAGVAAALGLASVKGAVYNVFINLESIKNEEFKEEYYGDCQHLLELANRKAKSVVEYMYYNAFKGYKEFDDGFVKIGNRDSKLENL